MDMLSRFGAMLTGTKDASAPSGIGYAALLKFITVVWPLTVIAILAFFVLFHRPMRQILARISHSDISRFRLGPLEIETRRRPKRKRASRRKGKPPTSK
jgi:hypothetical protein